MKLRQSIRDTLHFFTCGAERWLAAFFLVYPLYAEQVACAGLSLPLTAEKALLALALGAGIVLCANLPRRPALGFAAAAVLCCTVSIMHISQFIYWNIFQTPYFLRSAQGLGAALEFWHVAVAEAVQNTGYLILYAAQPVVLFIWARRAMLRRRRRGPRRAPAAAFLALALCAAAVLAQNSEDMALLTAGYVPVPSARRLGIVPAMALNAKYDVFGAGTQAAGADLSQLEIQQASGQAAQADAARLPGREYGENVMDISFDLEEQDAVLQDMNRYFSEKQPTSKNEYTGMFKGKNLIYITAEGFSKFLIDEQRTPVLYRMAAEGFQFEHFYTPLWGVSTSDGEFAATTSLVPKSGTWSYTDIIGHEMPFAMGNLFRQRGAQTFGFHNHSYTYYNRDKSMPTMGYTYYGQGHGLELTGQWPESDVEMMEQSVPMYAGEPSFHVYYMTVSGHLGYTFDGNMMAAKHKQEVEDLPYSEEVKAYIACNLELEYALESLLEQLEAAGALENTVIALTPDHYPYGLTDEQYAELRGEESLDGTFELYESVFLLWTPAMEQPVQVDTVCSSLDILPTLLNLFGFEYDSRLLMGTDVFSGTAPIVVFADKSFITDEIFYDAANGLVIQRTGKAPTQEYLDACMQKVNDMFAYSARIIETDYYGYLFSGQ